MIKKFSFILLLWFAFIMSTCEKDPAVTTYDPIGEWILTGVFLSDAKDTPCGWQINDHRNITLKFEKDTKGAVKISGKSVVNSYGGNVETLNYNNAEKKGAIKISNFSTTEIGASSELMQCEERFYTMLHTATEFTFDTNGNLHIGQLKKANSNPRDGGTYLIFEKK